MFHVLYRIRIWLQIRIRNWSRIRPYVVGLFIQSSIRIFLLIVLGTGFVVSVTREPSIKLILAVAIPIIVYAVLDRSTLNDKRRTANEASEFRFMVQNFKRRRGREPRNQQEIIEDFHKSREEEFYGERAKELYERLGKDLTA